MGTNTGYSIPNPPFPTLPLTLTLTEVGTTKGELGTLSAVSRALGQLKEEVAQKREANPNP